MGVAFSFQQHKAASYQNSEEDMSSLHSEDPIAE
jgi:hypothetical protein